MDRARQEWLAHHVSDVSRDNPVYKDATILEKLNVSGHTITVKNAAIQPELVYFLASDASSFCTGGHYLVDGGLVAK